jgi:hypothetical protein
VILPRPFFIVLVNRSSEADALRSAAASLSRSVLGQRTFQIGKIVNDPNSKTGIEDGEQIANTVTIMGIVI